MRNTDDDESDWAKLEDEMLKTLIIQSEGF